MTPAVRIEQDGRIERRDGQAIAIGGPAADIPVLGLTAAQPLAHVGVDDGALFVQPVDGAAVLLNGGRLQGPHWLRSGDTLAAGRTRIDVVGDEHGLRLVVAPVVDEPITEPPATVIPTVTDDPHRVTTVQPRAFTPRPIGRPTRSRPSAVSLWIAGLMLPLAIAAWFVLTARSIELTVTPPPDRLTLDAGLLHFTFDGRHLIRPGSYPVRATRVGYEPLDRQLTVGPEGRQSFRYELVALPGVVTVSTSPADGVELTIDDRLVGTTPLDPVQLPGGVHQFAARKDGFVELATTVEIAGAGQAQQIRLELLADGAILTMTTQPPGATVAIDGTPVDQELRTPLTTFVGSGRHSVSYTLAGFEAAARDLTVVAGEDQTLETVELQPARARLQLASVPGGATVTVDGVYRGTTPLELALAPDSEQIVRLAKSGHATAERPITLRSGARREMTIELTSIEGEVEVVAVPAGAALWIDGVAVGDANQTVRLAATEHRIEVRKPGFVDFVRTVTPRPGLRQTIRAELQRQDEPALSAAAQSAPINARTASGSELRRIGAGRLRLGASRREPGRRSNETLLEVQLTRPFYLGVREVTNAEFRAFRPTHDSGRAEAKSLDGDTQPVVRVTWEDAAAYCNWLSAAESLPPAYAETDGRLVAIRPPPAGYRLPTEAEWAWAARYPDGGARPLKYPWGDEMPVVPGAGNFADGSAHELLGAIITNYDDGFPATAPVATFAANPLGLYDIGGNVAEWIHDGYAIDHGIGDGGDGDGPVRDPYGPVSAEYHVIRGSSWMHATVSELRLSYRDYGNKARPDVGFRIARFAE